MEQSSSSNFSRNQKVILVAVAVGMTVMGLMARYFRRPTRRRIRSAGTSRSPVVFKPSNNGGKVPAFSDSNLLHEGEQRSLHSGSTLPPRLSPRGSHQRDRDRSSVCSSIITQTTLVSNSIDPGANLSSTQLGILGLETLEKSISFWEESLQLLKNNVEECSVTDEDDNDIDKDTNERTMKQLENILDAAYSLQRLSEELYLDEGSVLYGESERMSYGRLRSVSSVESFMSAEDFLSDDEEIRLSLQAAGFLPGEAQGDGVFPLYEAAMRLVEAGTVPHRSLKTEMVGCKHGDQEYLAKLHCLRGAFSRIISDPEKRHWISAKGREVFSEILAIGDRDPFEFQTTYEAMILWCQDVSNWGLIESELKDRGLRALTFYDIVLDFIFLDAFEDLEAPPASVLAVTQNRWLSNSFKETALSTAVWSVLKTKRKWLRYPEGFMAHFYDLSEHIMPTLAWGFLGPPSVIQGLCTYFKDKFLEFLDSVYSFDKVRYTTLDDLAVDVMTKLELMYTQIMERITEIQSAESSI